MRLKYICESCGRTEIFEDPEEAFDEGWDYPPKMGKFGKISPRTCGNCGIENTLYWKLITNSIISSDKATANGEKLQKNSSGEPIFSASLSSKDSETVMRILNEPESIMVDEDEEL